MFGVRSLLDKLSCLKEAKMPQIYAIIDVKAKAILRAYFSLLSPELIKVIEEGFGLEALDDVAFTAVPAIWTQGEKNIQIEIRYTAGKDEYHRGTPFDPSEEEQDKISDLVHAAFEEFLKKHKLPHVSLSVWCKPHYKSVFKAYE